MSAAPTASDALLRKRLATRHKPMGWVESIPIEDPRQTHRTLSPDQLRITLLALDMETDELRALFGISRQVCKNWTSGRTPLPKGVADYLRLRVSQRIRALSIGTGTPVSLEEDLPSDVPSMRSLAAIDQILSDLRIYLAG
jgi:hypothetical protein